MPNALQLLRDDHDAVKDLFKQFENTDDKAEQERIAKRAIMELEVHADIEEEIFYPALRKQDDVESDMMNEAEEEHHVVKLLIAELKAMTPRNERFKAKFTVLAENVKHHIQEEETEMLPKAAEEGTDRMEQLGDKMAMRKQQLMTQMMNPRRATANGRTSGPAKGRTTAGRTKRTAATGVKRTTRTATTAVKRTVGTAATGAKRTARAATGAAKRTTRAAAGTGASKSSTTSRERSAARSAAPSRTRAKPAATRSTSTRAKAGATSRGRAASKR